MKNYNHNRTAITLTIACLCFIGMLNASQAGTAGAESHRVAVTERGSSNLASDGHLIVRRIPNLGNHVIVNLSIDGVAALPVVYGQTYEGLLTPGRHLLSVTVTPSPKWPGSSTQLVLNVRKGQTYNFTAMGDGSGNLFLKPS